jgi:hypothetical protein
MSATAQDAAIARATGRTWEERVDRALARAESREHPVSAELRVSLALQDRRTLAVELRRLQVQVIALTANGVSDQ